MKKKQQNLPVKAKSTDVITVNQEKATSLDITQKLHHLKNRSEVRKFLPDILGRVLARIWIDSNFKEQFESSTRILKESGFTQILSKNTSNIAIREDHNTRNYHFKKI